MWTPNQRRARIVYLATLLPLALAHDHGHGDPVDKIAPASAPFMTASRNFTMATPTAVGSASANSTLVAGPQSYFEHVPHSGLMLAHIALMVVAWMLVLPVGVMLGLARSHLGPPLQLAFVVLYCFGLLAGTIYNRSTPELYSNNAHHKLGWVITGIFAAQIGLGAVGSYLRRSENDVETTSSQACPSSLHRRASSSDTMVEEQIRLLSGRPSQDSSNDTNRASSLFSGEKSPAMNPDSAHDVDPNRVTSDTLTEGDVEHQGTFSCRTIHSRASLRLSPQPLVAGLLRISAYIYAAISRTILLLGYVALLTGIVTYTGIFHGRNVFNGLAHFIKGSVFLWCGLLTLSRWAGSFASLGWSWNLVSPASSSRSPPTAEFIESALFFIYGASNVFLEHLAAWGGAWTAMDLEHVSISIMLFGGGLCGMLIESKRLRNLFTLSLATSPEKEPQPQLTVSLNPFPALLTLLLGIVMSGHHQHSETSATVHAHWGNLLIGAALARGVTYVLMYLKPPTSALPSRPPSELITAFCLISGGGIFMASNKDTIAAMERYSLNAMFIFTVAMGFTAMLMAWVLVVVAVKGWAVRFEARRSKRMQG